MSLKHRFRTMSIFVTKNGYGELVVMSMETYDEQLRRLEFYQELAISEKTYDRCRTRVQDSKVESNPDVQSADKLFEPFVFGKAAVQAFPHPWPRVDWVVLGIASSHGICAPAIQTDDLDFT